MLNPKPNSVHVSVKKKKKANSLYETPNKLGSYQANLDNIPMWVLFLKLLKSFRIPFISAKHQLTQWLRSYFGTKPFPWFKVSLLVLGLYMVFQKDMNFQVNMKSPDTITSDDRQNNNEPTAMSMSLPSLKAIPTPAKEASAIAHLNLNKEQVNAYVTRFTRIAVMEMQKFNIPASVKMGQGILASQAGGNSLAVQHNNHFGTLCGQAAGCANFNSSIGTVKVKTYGTAWDGWRDHSLMISNAPYHTLAKECGRDYKKWAVGIARIGYNNNQEYSKQLIEVIETYQLYKLDEINAGM